jgi:hypothetical protein
VRVLIPYCSEATNSARIRTLRIRTLRILLVLFGTIAELKIRQFDCHFGLPSTGIELDITGTISPGKNLKSYLTASPIVVQARF